VVRGLYFGKKPAEKRGKLIDSTWTMLLKASREEYF